MKNCVKIITIVLVLIILLPTSNLRAATPVIQEDDASKIFLPMVSGHPLPPQDEASQYITLPEGFEVRIFAQNLPTSPRMMTFGPDGQLYVSLMYSGQIARLPDQNHDGLADKVEIVVSGLDYPHGIDFFNDGEYDWLYVADGNSIWRYKYSDTGEKFEKDGYRILLPSPGLNSTRTLHFSPDGYLYVSVGSKYNDLSDSSDPRDASILRYQPDGTTPPDNPFYSNPDLRLKPVFAQGLRYSVDFVWTASGDLWANHNGTDSSMDTIPPEEVVISVQSGKHHGWPYCYTPGIGVVTQMETKFPNQSGWNCEDVVPAIFTTQAHASPLGMALGESWIFPQEYQDSLYISYSGSWDDFATANHPDCKIERILLEDGQPASEETFALFYREEGKECGAYGTWGRPVDIIFGPNGNMYISDDIGMRIYRVIYIP